MDQFNYESIIFRGIKYVKKAIQKKNNRNKKYKHTVFIDIYLISSFNDCNHHKTAYVHKKYNRYFIDHTPHRHYQV